VGEAGARALLAAAHAAGADSAALSASSGEGGGAADPAGKEAGGPKEAKASPLIMLDLRNNYESAVTHLGLLRR
jgi:hypothetical protein